MYRSAHAFADTVRTGHTDLFEKHSVPTFATSGDVREWGEAAALSFEDEYDEEKFQQCAEIDLTKMREATRWHGLCIVMRYRRPGRRRGFKRAIVGKALDPKAVAGFAILRNMCDENEPQIGHFLLECWCVDEEDEDGNEGAFLELPPMRKQVRDGDVRALKAGA